LQFYKEIENKIQSRKKIEKILKSSEDYLKKAKRILKMCVK